MRHTPISIACFGLCCALLAGCNTSTTNLSSGNSTPASAAVNTGTPPATTSRRAGDLAVFNQAEYSAVASAPVAAAVAPPATLPPVTIHLAGDSTVSNYPATTVQEGWGMELGQFFNDKVTVNNQAQGGANVQSFYRSSNWSRIIAALKPGDYVLMQFGANDSGTAHGPVSPPDFADTLGQMADEIRAKGATPIFVTPSAFFDWSADGKENNARLAPYAAACYTAGAAKNALVDDLNARGVEWLNSIGKATAAPFYLPNSQHVPDKAHFVKAGAVQMAKMVAQEIGRIHSPLAAYLK